MKIHFLFLFLFFLFNCGSQTNNQVKNTSADPTLIADQLLDSNANKFKSIEDAESETDEVKRKEIEEKNAKYEIVPDEWKAVNFNNFSYPVKRMKGFIHLKNGEFEYSNREEYDNQFGEGGGSYYVDLTGDNVKEAVVFVSAVACGGSCDGGSEIIYFYSMQNKKLGLLGRIESGSRAYGCSLKSFTIKNKEIIIEQFGRCQKDSSKNEDKDYSCKFCVKDLTVSTYIFENRKLKKKFSKIISTPEVEIKNFAGETYSIE